MPQDEVVTHAALALECATPEEAALTAVTRPQSPRAAQSTVAVTVRALDAFVELRARECSRPDQAIGVVRAGDGVGLVLDVPGAGDRVFARAGVAILFIATDLGKRLDGRVLDYGGVPGRKRFTFRRRAIN